MKCISCNNELSVDAKFCSGCGTEAKLADEKQHGEAIVIKSPVKKSILDQALAVGIWMTSFIIGRFLGLVFFLFLGAYLLGQWFPSWYLKRDKISITLVKWIVWSNVLTWFLPPLGIATGFAALEFGNHFPGDRKKYKTLAIIGIVASLLNALSGVLMNI